MALSLCIIGESGQVAGALAHLASEDPACSLRIVTVPRTVIDLAETETLKEKIKAVIRAAGPFDALINAAAYTDVDKAEQEEAIALKVNGFAPGILAEVCADHGLPFLHLSTDYVFDGTKSTPYQEIDQTSPVGAYGRSKLKAEHLILSQYPHSFIGRTAWVYSATGHNFVKTMLGLRNREALGVVADQLGTPTSADDIAATLVAIAYKMADGIPGGLYHLAGTGSTSWHGFAEATFEIAQSLDGGARPMVSAITSAEFPTAAKRPANSRLDCGKLFRDFDIKLPYWRHSLLQCLKAF